MNKWVSKGGSGLDLSLIMLICQIPNFRVLSSILPDLSLFPSIFESKLSNEQDSKWMNERGSELDLSHMVSWCNIQYFRVLKSILPDLTQFPSILGQSKPKASKPVSKWERKWARSLLHHVMMLYTKFQSPNINITRFISVSFNFESK